MPVWVASCPSRRCYICIPFLFSLHFKLFFISERQNPCILVVNLLIFLDFASCKCYWLLQLVFIVVFDLGSYYILHDGDDRGQCQCQLGLVLLESQ